MKILKLTIIAALLMWTANASAGHSQTCVSYCKAWNYNFQGEYWDYQKVSCDHAYSIVASPEDVEFHYDTCSRQYTYDYSYNYGHNYWRNGRHYQRNQRRHNRYYRHNRHYRHNRRYRHNRHNRRHHRKHRRHHRRRNRNHNHR